MRIYKIKNGWRVRMPAVKHHTSKLTLDALFQIHEKGCTISGKNGTIVIPARPAFQRAYKKIMRNISKGEVAEVKRAVTKYLKTGIVPK
jgi:DNA-binding cell septation regulator SpoVG